VLENTFFTNTVFKKKPAPPKYGLLEIFIFSPPSEALKKEGACASRGLIGGRPGERQ